MFPYWSIDLDQSDVGFLIHVFDLGVERGSALQLHLEEMKSLVPFTLTSSTTRLRLQSYVKCRARVLSPTIHVQYSL